MTFPADTTASTMPDAVDRDAAPATPAAGEPHVRTPDTDRRTDKSRRTADLAAIAVYAGLSVLLMVHFLRDPAGRVSAHLAIDQTWFEWLLAHGAYSVQHLENP